MPTLIYSQLIFCCIQCLLIQSALKISQLSFFLGYPLPLPCAFSHIHLISPCFSISTRIFVSLLRSCPFHSVHLSGLFPILSALRSVFCSIFCSYSSFEDTWSLDLPPWKHIIYCTFLYRLWSIKMTFLLQVSHLRRCCASQSTGEASLNSFALQFYPCWRIKTFCLHALAFVASQAKQD